MNGSQVASPAVASLSSVSPLDRGHRPPPHVLELGIPDRAGGIGDACLDGREQPRAVGDVEPSIGSRFRRAACMGTMPASEKKSAVLLCSGVRAALFDFPRDLTSLYSST